MNEITMIRLPDDNIFVIRAVMLFSKTQLFLNTFVQILVCD